MSDCPRCGEPVRPADRFCEACGADTTQARPCVGCGATGISAEGYCDACGRLQPRPRDHYEIAVGASAGVSDRGLRHPRNEDAFALRELDHAPGTVVVACDGVSSAVHAEVASQVAADTGVETILEALRGGADPEAATHDAALAALRAVADLAGLAGLAIGGSPACTYVSAVVTPAAITVGWVGDSRAYWIPATGSQPAAARLTEDDSWLAAAVASGVFTAEQASADRRAHAITAWLGADADDVQPHVATLEPDGAGIVLVCTDGLWNYLDTADTVAAALPVDARDAPLGAAQELVRLALAQGGHDNVTVVLVPYDREDR